ncbi:ATP-binding cassette domain-containing protein [Paralimibaculum aggregatum]|uniref:ATP-binding cassette domain-containing protein n=1 Tax=Paralimibaculum aggregatum TaxID=3036245 RepID=A0ABQ6LTC8_9RHOB|nr:ATP-binding cassette domain-containing protein [Limibaculum sp. NKW23]GMG85335.1 ATP-binding cassette domain-containing protein [Limibaculum sp. NKW23]
MSTPVPVLEVEGLAFSRGPGAEDFRLSLPALRLARGGFLALAGESGSGKSTLLDLLGLIERPGRVARFRLCGRDLAPALAAGDLEAVAAPRRSLLGYILQSGGLLPFLTVADNIAITRPADRPAPFAVGDLAARLGLEGLLRRKPEAISIGQRQRVAIARAIMGDPAVILADEPTAALDPPTARATLRLLCALAAERGTAVVMASHSWALIREFSLPVLTARMAPEADGGGVVFAPGSAEGLAA